MKRKFFMMPIMAVTAISVMTGCMSKEAKSVQKKIDLLPESYSEGILSDLQEASAEYEALVSEDRDDVDVDRIEELYEQYYETISDNINKQISEFNPENYNSTDTYAGGLEKLNEIITAIEQADIKAYPDIDFSLLRSKLTTYKCNLMDFSSEVTSMSITFQSIETKLKTVAVSYNDYSALTDKFDDILSDMEKVPEKFKNDFTDKLKELRDFTASNTYSDNNASELVSKYESAVNAYNNMIENINSYYENMDINAFEKQTDELIDNIEKLNDKIDNANESAE